jgi:protein-L-isoaspartate(D-aspartate) O-methyltransferase
VIVGFEREGIRHEGVLAAMREVDRALFVPASERDAAYGDHPLPIGHGQTISQPFVVAFLAQALDPSPADRILEIGAGSGYQAAVLSRIVGEVFSLEIIPALAEQAARNLETAGIDNVTVARGDGYEGWPDEAPFDGILLTAAPAEIPAPLKKQLAPGGRLVAPVGEARQEVVVLRREPDGSFAEESLLPVRFVPMTGRAETGGGD